MKLWTPSISWYTVGLLFQRLGYIFTICYESPEWLKLNVTEAMMPIVCRANNCTFVGAPLCPSLPLFDIHKIFNKYGTGRNPDYMDLNINFAVAAAKAAAVLRYFPRFLKP